MKTRSWEQDRSGAMIPSTLCGKRWPGNCSVIKREVAICECGLERIGRELAGWVEFSCLHTKFFLLRSRENGGSGVSASMSHNYHWKVLAMCLECLEHLTHKIFHNHQDSIDSRGCWASPRPNPKLLSGGKRQGFECIHMWHQKWTFCF